MDKGNDNANLQKIMFEKQLTFIRIPKNASTSIYHHIKPINTIVDDRLPFLPYHNKIFAPSHCSLSQAVKALGDEILKKICFAVCRNPYDRMVSQFCFAKKESFIPIDFKDFAEFVEFCVTTESIASFSQSYYLDMDVDIKILRFENLQRDFTIFCRSSGILMNTILPIRNKTDHKHYLDYYTPQLKEKVKEFWAEDFKRFDYN